MHFKLTRFKRVAPPLSIWYEMLRDICYLSYPKSEKSERSRPRETMHGTYLIDREQPSEERS